MGSALVSFLYARAIISDKNDQKIERLIQEKNYNKLTLEVSKLHHINALYFINALDPRIEQEAAIIRIAIGDQINYWMCKAVQEDSAKCVENLLSLGADIEAIVDDGKTPLFYAIEEKSENAIRALLRNGANKFACSIHRSRGIASFAWPNRLLAEFLENKAAKELEIITRSAPKEFQLPKELIHKIAYNAVGGWSQDVQDH